MNDAINSRLFVKTMHFLGKTVLRPTESLVNTRLHDAIAAVLSYTETALISDVTSDFKNYIRALQG